MRLKSPTKESISFGTATGSGHSMVLGPEGAEVPQMFIQSAFAAGAIPEGSEADEFVAAPISNMEKTPQELVQSGIKTMLERSEEGDFTAGGLPNRKKLAALIGMNVTADDVAIAWKALNESL